jgi:hypothetical protein
MGDEGLAMLATLPMLEELSLIGCNVGDEGLEPLKRFKKEGLDEVRLEPAGFENAQGIITTQFTKQAGDPAWASDPEVTEYVEFMKKWVPNDNPGDFVALSGYIIAQGISDALSSAETI